jgi:regulator of sigma E protease
LEPNDPNRPDDLKAGTITPSGPPNGTPPDNGNGGAPTPPPPLSLTGWLLNNFLYVIIVAAIGYLLYRGGLDWLLRAGLVVVGLGFIIFVHELGHFLAAKWCDVHVQTFSIGFGPALPGCSFVRGETTYKIAVLPLGGYVNMVGEGPEADEDENYPRSFKNKSVFQRMLIISAGVIMNMIFAAVVFVTVYLTVGERRPTAVIAETDAGSPAWRAGVRPGWKIVEVGGRKTSFFDDVQVKVSVVSKDTPVSFRFEALPDVPAAPGDAIDLVPHKDANNMAPVVGLIAASRLKLPSLARKKNYASPVVYYTPAASARSFELEDGDVPVASTNPGSDGLVPIKDKDPWQELSARLRKTEASDAFTVKVRGKDGKDREVQAGVGFDFGDSILATTDPATPDRPFNVTPLPLDPNHEEAEYADPLAFRRRMVQLRGKPAVVQVKRDKTSGESGTALVLVPPAYHVTFGMLMKMGEVAAIRENSPAEKAGVQQQDVIAGVELRFDGGKWEALAGPLDPVRLPDQLYDHVHKDPKRDPNKWQVRLTVKRHPGHDQETKALPPMDWDDSWKPGDDGPLAPASPLAIPQLGLAYRIDSMVVADPPKDSPADKAGIKKGDEIRAIRVRLGGKTPADSDAEWSNWRDMKNKVKGGDVYDQWAYYFDVVQQGSESHLIQVEVYRANAKFSSPELKAEPDTSWPMADRGISLSQDTRRQKASGLVEAVKMGLDKTWRTTQYIYSILSSVVTGQISTKGMGGPVAIAGGAFAAAQDVSMFLLLLGVISINLAVVNFLPIPILDGGHMVFLIYEGVRGKPPPESVRVIATYVGLILILFLMVFVFYNDLERLGLFEWLRWFRK